MKKIIALLLALMMLSLVACTGNGDASSTDSTNAPSSSETTSDETPSADTAADSGKITLGDVTVSVGMTITEDIINQIGTPDDVMSAPSCFFDGEDTIYVYPDFSLYTYRDGDKDYLYIIELSTDKYQTALGGKVGMTVADVEEIYGLSTGGTSKSLVYKLDDTSKLRFTFDESETITLIEYELIG